MRTQGVSNRDIKLENTLLEAQQGRRPMLKLCGTRVCSDCQQYRTETLPVGLQSFELVLPVQEESLHQALAEVSWAIASPCLLWPPGVEEGRM